MCKEARAISGESTVTLTLKNVVSYADKGKGWITYIVSCSDVGDVDQRDPNLEVLDSKRMKYSILAADITNWFSTWSCMFIFLLPCYHVWYCPTVYLCSHSRNVAYVNTANYLACYVFLLCG